MIKTLATALMERGLLMGRGLRSMARDRGRGKIANFLNWKWGSMTGDMGSPLLRQGGGGAGDGGRGDNDGRHGVTVTVACTVA